MNNGEVSIQGRQAMTVIWKNVLTAFIVCLYACAGAAQIPVFSNDDKTFEYTASPLANIAVCGGCVKGEFSSRDSSIYYENGSLVFKYPADGVLAFLSAGNIPVSEGTVMFELAYTFDTAVEIDALKRTGKWSFIHTVFSSGLNNTGFRFFFETQKSLSPAEIRITVMNSSQPYTWQYYGVNLKKEKYPPGKIFKCGFSWKNSEIAIIADDNIVYRVDMKTAPVWGDKFQIGGTGQESFCGSIKSMKVYKKAAF